MNSNQIGNYGESKVLSECLRLGYQVFLPYGDGNRIDLILLKDNKTYKVQIKTSETDDNGTITFNTQSTKSTRQESSVHIYTEDEIDFFLLYSIVRDKIYLLPVKDAPKRSVMIRYIKPEKMMNTVRLEEDYLFEKKILEY